MKKKRLEKVRQDAEDFLKGNGGAANQPQKIPVAYVDDLPKVARTFFSECHKVRALYAYWDAPNEILLLTCSECKRPISGFKIEKKGRIITL